MSWVQVPKLPLNYAALPEPGLSGLIANQLLRKGPEVQILHAAHGNVILIGKEPFWKDGSNRASGVWVQIPAFPYKAAWRN